MRHLLRAPQNNERLGSMDAAHIPPVAYNDLALDATPSLARIFHRGVEQRSGEGVRRLVNTEPYANATHRFFNDRL
jgi:hypothetical protein